MERVKFERKWVNLTAAPVNYSNMPQSFRESTIPIIMIIRIIVEPIPIIMITIIVNYSNMLQSSKECQESMFNYIVD